MKEDIKKLMAGIVEREADALRNIPVTDAYADAIDLIVEHVGRRGGKLVTSGMGKAGQIAMNIATTFSSTGTPAVFLHPSEAQHGDLGVMQPDDLLPYTTLFRSSGKTREIVELVELARAMNPDVPVIVITGDGGSLLAREGNVTLHRRCAGGMSAGIDPHHIHHHDDRDGRCACGRHYARDRFQP